MVVKMNNFAVIDCRMSQKCQNSLKNIGFTLIDVPQNNYLDKPVSAHPDIQMFSIYNDILADKTLAEKLKHMFSTGECNYKIRGFELYDFDTRYPYDCTLNFAVCGNKLIGNRRIINHELLHLAEMYSMEIIDVNQGYAKCNICVVNDNAIITEDKGIAKACIKNGLSVLLLETNSVKLKGYKNGFIGGASGTIFFENKNTVMFCGDITMHPEYNRISEFVHNNGAEYISLSDEPLYDYGSIFVL